MAAVLPMRPHAWELGAVEFRATPSARFFNPMGSVHGGWAMTMLDTAMGVAAHTTLKPGQTYASLDTSVRFVRPIMGKTGELRILGSVQSRGRRVITVNGRIENESGKLFALGTSACQITDPRSR
ncbi:MAG: PaaI family thioesterase [Roseitalea sp.]|nr:PaaI family thioesterase [Roseitalea sp.]MBO6723684.1 PaaI family thioesterase [Roseitalea sp.]MBO6744024.1 PaaI family thioesterase [Roseitalea sp.]